MLEIVVAFVLFLIAFVLGRKHRMALNLDRLNAEADRAENLADEVAAEFDKPEPDQAVVDALADRFQAANDKVDAALPQPE